MAIRRSTTCTPARATVFTRFRRMGIAIRRSGRSRAGMSSARVCCLTYTIEGDDVHIGEVCRSGSRGRPRISYPLAELNDLLTAATGAEVESLWRPEIEDPYRLNYVTAMVELAAHRTGVVPSLWTASVPPLPVPVFIDRSLKLRAHLLTASPVPFRRRNIFIDTSLGGRV